MSKKTKDLGVELQRLRDDCNIHFVNMPDDEAWKWIKFFSRRRSSQ